MKFSEMPYQRPDIPALREKLEALRARIEGAQSADEAERAYRESDALSQQYATATSLAYIRHSIDTRERSTTRKTPLRTRTSPSSRRWRRP